MPATPPTASAIALGLLDPADLEAVRRPFKAARLLPPRVFHDPAILDYEQVNWFGRDWICVGRAEEAANRGEYFLATVAGENVMVLRGADGELRAFHNVCRHRGSTILEESCGKLVRIQCPYHAWTYDLEGAPPAGEAHRGPRRLRAGREQPRSRSAASSGRGSCS